MGRARKIKVHIVDDIFEELTVYPCSKIVKSSGHEPAHSDNGMGYKTVCFTAIRKTGKKFSRRYYVHRLMAKAFLKDPGGLHVNHLDFNRGNNALSNLEVVTCTENHRWTGINGRIRHSHPYKEFVRVLRMHFNLGYPVFKIIKKTGLPRDFVRDTICGEQKNYTERYMSEGNALGIVEFKVSHWGRRRMQNTDKKTGRFIPSKP